MKIIEILRLSEMGASQREIALSAGCGKSTIGDVLRRCKGCGIDHAVASGMTNDALQNAIYPTAESQGK